MTTHTPTSCTTQRKTKWFYNYLLESAANTNRETITHAKFIFNIKVSV
jgi:hypothetical protein